MTIDADLLALATGKNFAALTTLMADGQPQTQIMWVHADDDHVYAVVGGPTTVANLLRTGKATLSVIIGDAAIHTKMQVVAVVQDDDWLGAVLTVVSHKRDGVGVPLIPARYLATAAVATDESWERSRSLLERLTHHPEKGARHGATGQPA